MPQNPEFGKHLRDAKRAYEQRHDVALSWREIGERLAKKLKRPEPVRSQAVGEWFQKGQEPDDFYTTMKALAAVLETTPGVLVFGEWTHVGQQEPAMPRSPSLPRKSETRRAL